MKKMKKRTAITQPEQLWLPHLAPNPALYFRDPANELLFCGHSFLNNAITNLKPLKTEYPCNNPAMLQAIYFRYGSPITAKDLKHPDRDASLIGLDSLFGDSDQVFACGVHITTLLEQARIEYDLPKTPDVLVNALGELEETMYQRVALRTAGIIVPQDYFSAKKHSQEQESLRELWQRERHHFQF